jgi:hypothetical protein
VSGCSFPDATGSISGCDNQSIDGAWSSLKLIESKGSAPGKRSGGDLIVVNTSLTRSRFLAVRRAHFDRSGSPIAEKARENRSG